MAFHEDLMKLEGMPCCFYRDFVWLRNTLQHINVENNKCQIILMLQQGGWGSLPTHIKHPLNFITLDYTIYEYPKLVMVV